MKNSVITYYLGEGRENFDALYYKPVEGISKNVKPGIGTK